MSRESFQAPGDRAAGRGVEQLSCSPFAARPRLVVRFRLDVYKTACDAICHVLPGRDMGSHCVAEGPEAAPCHGSVLGAWL